MLPFDVETGLLYYDVCAGGSSGTPRMAPKRLDGWRREMHLIARGSPMSVPGPRAKAFTKELDGGPSYSLDLSMQAQGIQFLTRAR